MRKNKIITHDGVHCKIVVCKTVHVFSPRSLEWKCPQCGAVTTMLLPVTEASKETTKEAEALASQIAFQVGMNVSFRSVVRLASLLEWDI